MTAIMSSQVRQLRLPTSSIDRTGWKQLPGCLAYAEFPVDQEPRIHQQPASAARRKISF